MSAEFIGPFNASPEKVGEDDSAETAKDKKKRTAYSLGETLFKADQEPETPKEKTFWDRLHEEIKQREPKTAETEESSTDETDEAVVREAGEEFIVERQAVAREELRDVPLNSPEAVEFVADAAFLHNTHEQLEAETSAPEEVVDQAYQQTTEAVEAAINRAATSGEQLARESAFESVPESSPEITQPVYAYNPIESEAIALPVANAPEAAVTQQQLQHERDSAYAQGRAGGLFAGGIVGYLWGRRKGRIRTERQLLPVQERLKTRVKQLENLILRRETDIRKLTAQKIEAQQNVPYQRVAEQIQIRPNLSADEQRLSPLTTAPPEQLPTSRYADVLPLFKQPEELSSREALAIAEKVIVDGVSVKEMYENRKFNEPALRRIVAEFLAGGNVKKKVAHEVLQKERSFELDPQLREGSTIDQNSTSNYSATSDQKEAFLHQATNAQQTAQSSSPRPSSRALHDLRIRQATTIAGVTLVIMLAILIALVATR